MKVHEHPVTITDDDVRFLELTLEHYRLFAETAANHGEKRTAGIMRKQEFHAERMLERVKEQMEGAER